WFKQAQLFQLEQAIKSSDDLNKKLAAFSFSPCLPSLQKSIGWVPPIEDEADSLVCAANNYLMICLQIEEKILPSIVVQQALTETIKQIETSENRKLRQKEKFSLKEEIIMTLLPRAFSKLTKVYAYIDLSHQRLVLGTTNPKKTELFISFLKKSSSGEIRGIDIKNISLIMTDWLKTQNFPHSFSIAKACVLQDPQQEKRVIRCKQQDLFVNGIQALIKDTLAVQLALTWEDRIDFVLAKDFSLSSIQFHDEIVAESKEIEAETKQQQFMADFLIMTGLFTHLFNELLTVFGQFIKTNNVIELEKKVS
ncbi:MAG: recombination-associated protein RdgC, partial [Gammaproteobacteria bacterium]|nr:recombination-associated protein RdgC [Gammaproteobacteria bacterium]